MLNGGRDASLFAEPEAAWGGWKWRGGEEEGGGGPLEALSVMQHSWDGGGRGASIPNDSHLSKVGNGAATELSIPESSRGRGSWSGRGGERTCDLSFEQAAFGLSRCGGGRGRRRTEGFFFSSEHEVGITAPFSLLLLSSEQSELCLPDSHTHTQSSVSAGLHIIHVCAALMFGMCIVYLDDFSLCFLRVSLHSRCAASLSFRLLISVRLLCTF